MALTNTTKAKEFTAGAPLITLKGDLRPKKEMKMASDDMNERFLEQLYEQLLDEGFSPEEAAKKARQLAAERSMADGGRAQYGLGSLVKKIGKGIKGAVKGIGSVLKSPAGLLALNFAPMLVGGKPFIGMGGGQFNLPGLSGIKEFFTGGSKAMNALKVGGAGAAITGLLSGMCELTLLIYDMSHAPIKSDGVGTQTMYPSESSSIKFSLYLGSTILTS